MMIERDEMWSRFGARFVASFRSRLARATEAERASDVDAFIVEMHALGGEAGMLGIDGVVETAVSLQRVAHRWDMDPSARATCRRLLEGLEESLARLGAARQA
jgi:HPt (histidine-containing phosphotransfer) domain-containing protein